MSTPTDSLSLAKFSASLKTRFRVRTSPATLVALELVEATERSPAPGAAGKEARYECFSLLFHGPADSFLGQGTYAFEHEGMGAFELFIVPVGQAPGIFHYQAIFNRVR